MVGLPRRTDIGACSPGATLSDTDPKPTRGAHEPYATNYTTWRIIVTGTIVSLRLTNQVDQGVVKTALPDTVAGLAETLPSLRTGEALVTGEAFTLPTRVLVARPSPEPAAIDPSIMGWMGDPTEPDLIEAAAIMRGRIVGS